MDMDKRHKKTERKIGYKIYSVCCYVVCGGCVVGHFACCLNIEPKAQLNRQSTINLLCFQSCYCHLLQARFINTTILTIGELLIIMHSVLFWLRGCPFVTFGRQR
eukprot:m.141210 g.141210  ORF g.141210 m.141210 type:complete len:105 (+) comp30168_c0_seq1:901-1215(+)